MVRRRHHGTGEILENATNPQPRSALRLTIATAIFYRRWLGRIRLTGPAAYNSFEGSFGELRISPAGSRQAAISAPARDASQAQDDAVNGT